MNLPDNVGDARDAALIPGSGRTPGVGNGNPLQYSCLGNPMDRWDWLAGLSKGLQRVRHQLSTHTRACTHTTPNQAHSSTQTPESRGTTRAPPHKSPMAYPLGRTQPVVKSHVPLAHIHQITFRLIPPPGWWLTWIPRNINLGKLGLFWTKLVRRCRLHWRVHLQWVFPPLAHNSLPIPNTLHCLNTGLALPKENTSSKTFVVYSLPCCCSVTKSCPTLSTSWSAVHQAPLSSTISQSLLRFMSIESVVPPSCLPYSPQPLATKQGLTAIISQKGKKNKDTPPTRHIFPLLLLILFYVFILSFFFLPHHAVYKILISRPGIEPMPPAVKAQSLNHWTSREILLYFFRHSSPLSVLCCPVYNKAEVFHLSWVLYRYNDSLSLSLLYVLDVIHSPTSHQIN